MTSFTETSFTTKLDTLNASQQNIETLSLWVIHHRLHYTTIVKLWMQAYIAAKESRQLILMYLANDVIQNSRKKGKEYMKAFGRVFTKAFGLATENSNETKRSMFRLIKIWEDRRIYPAEMIEEYRKALKYDLDAGKESGEPSAKRGRSSSAKNVPSESKTANGNGKNEGSAETLTKRGRSSGKNAPIESKTALANYLEVSTVLPSISNTKSSQSQNHPKYGKSEKLEQERMRVNELVKALTDIENSASCDATVRENISQLPPEVSEVKLLKNVKDRKSAEKLLQLVIESDNVLTAYNKRLRHEMVDRKKLSNVLDGYLESQKQELRRIKKSIEETTGKINRINKTEKMVQRQMAERAEVVDLQQSLPERGDSQQRNKRKQEKEKRKQEKREEEKRKQEKREEEIRNQEKREEEKRKEEKDKCEQEKLKLEKSEREKLRELEKLKLEKYERDMRELAKLEQEKCELDKLEREKRMLEKTEQEIIEPEQAVGEAAANGEILFPPFSAEDLERTLPPLPSAAELFKPSLILNMRKNQRN